MLSGGETLKGKSHASPGMKGVADAAASEGAAARRPFILGIAGALAAGSVSELAADAILAHARSLGADTELIAGPALEAPIYAYGRIADCENMRTLTASIRKADGLVIVSPSYHGCVSGLVKNALDYVEELSREERPYLSGRPVACVAVAGGWQGASATLQALRNIVHALRGWPTPLGLAINSQQVRLPVDGAGGDEKINEQLKMAAAELLQFIDRR